MSWVWVLLVPFPGAVVVIPVLCAGAAVGNACRLLRQAHSTKTENGD